MAKLYLTLKQNCVSIFQKAGLFFIRNLKGTIPPRDLTLTRIHITEVRIRAFWKTHGYLPANLALLQVLKGRDNTTKDGWGREINYEIIGASTVILSSVGDDELADRSELNRSIRVIFNVNEEFVQ